MAKLTKVTKSTLQKENDALKIKITELEATIKQLEKEKMVVQTQLDFYTNLPKAATDMIGGSIDFLLKSTFPQAQK